MVSATSMKEYSAVLKRLLPLSDEARIMYLSKSKSRGSHFKIMAALKLFATHLNGKGKLDEAQQMNNLLTIKPIYKKRQSKSSIKLKDGWREALIERVVSSKTLHKQEILVAILTGLRPSELENGIRIIVDNDQVKFTIKGTKVKVGDDGKVQQGMAWRSIAYKLPNDDKALTFLLKMLKEENPVGNVYEVGLKSSLKGFSSALSKLGDGLVKTRGKSFSQYNLRHSFATLLKSSGCNDVDISRALGHISMKTKSYYGRTKAAPTGVSPSKITSSHTPRPYLRNYPASATAPNNLNG
jgi:integrase